MYSLQHPSVQQARPPSSEPSDTIADSFFRPSTGDVQGFPAVAHYADYAHQQLPLPLYAGVDLLALGNGGAESMGGTTGVLAPANVAPLAPARGWSNTRAEAALGSPLPSVSLPPTPPMGAQGYTFIQHYPPPPDRDSAPPVVLQGNREFIPENFEAGRLGRPSGACTRCKKLKMKCNMRLGERVCDRCKGGSHACIPARRRPRQRKNTNTAATASTGDGSDDDTDPLASHLRAGETLPPKTCPMGMIARLTIAGADETASEAPTMVGEEDEELPRPPKDAMGIFKLIGDSEAEQLHRLFVENINPCAAILDPELHTYDYIKRKSNFLLTTICAIASRHWPQRPALYDAAMEEAKGAAAAALVHDGKSVEAVQAYFLLSLYGKPVRRWEQDRGWLYSGVAIRMATDLNLHRTPPKDGASRETLNRARTWLVCFNLDRSFAAQFGRPPTIAGSLSLPVKEWWRSSALSHPYDLGSCAFAQLMEAMTGFREAVMGPEPDIPSLTREYDARFVAITNHWQPLLDSHRIDYPGCAYRGRLFPFCAEYTRLVMFSFGFQEAFVGGTLTRDNEFFVKSLDTAKQIVSIMTSELAPDGYYKYAFHSHYVYITFAAAFLLKLLRPKLVTILLPGERDLVIDLIRRVAATLASPQVAADGYHAPQHYARFLRSMLARHTPPSPSSSSPTSLPALDSDMPFLKLASYERPPLPDELQNPGWWDQFLQPGWFWQPSGFDEGMMMNTGASMPELDFGQDAQMMQHPDAYASYAF